MPMWSGLGMGLFSTTDTALFDSYCDTLKSFGITKIRVDIPSYQDTAWVAKSKAAVIRAIAKGMQVVWGVSSNSSVNAAYTITSANLADFDAARDEAFLWAVANGVYEFIEGNEEELHHDGSLTNTQIRDNIIAEAAAHHAINATIELGYSTGHDTIAGWIDYSNLGVLNYLAANVYSHTAGYATSLANMITKWGASKVYISEFNVHSSDVDTYSASEEAQAVRFAQYYEQIKTLGFTRAYYFCYTNNDEYADCGCLKSYGEATPYFRPVWNVLTTDNGRRWFINQ